MKKNKHQSQICPVCGNPLALSVRFVRMHETMRCPHCRQPLWLWMRSGRIEATDESQALGHGGES